MEEDAEAEWAQQRAQLEALQAEIASRPVTVQQQASETPSRELYGALNNELNNLAVSVAHGVEPP